MIDCEIGSTPRDLRLPGAHGAMKVCSNILALVNCIQAESWLTINIRKLYDQTLNRFSKYSI